MVKSLFSTLGSLMLVTVLCLSISLFYRLSPSYALCFAAFGWLVCGKLVLIMSFAQGYGVKEGTGLVLGMPAVPFVVTGIVACLLACLLVLAESSASLFPHTIEKLQAFSWCGMAGLMTAVCHWYFRAREMYFHESEYNIRKQCEARGDSPEVIELRIAHCRAQGIVR